MAYKKLIKVSNVCQVLDKRTYLSSGTDNGITFTHNGDGSYTANGTFASSGYSNFNFTGNITLLANHTYLVLNGTYYEAGKYSVWLVVVPNLVAESNGILYGNDYGSKTYTPKKNEKANLSMKINHKPNVDTINFTFKPQLFDLTEMYGAGHEPTSVEQFRQDFPDEMYDYSPRCWLTSYKRVILTGAGNYLTTYQRNLTCKTKNLFYNNQVYKIKDSLDEIIWRGEISVQCYFSWYQSLNSLKDPGVALFTLNYSDGSVSYSAANNELISRGRLRINSSVSKKLTSIVLCNWCFANGNIYNIQLELGDTATDYVPYGHL